ncbi:ATP-binding protein [Actinocorallia sp. B10E7]|uniref:ATP-binding protein n=1 Tax=Actinocorallia sp. B10E7 TaxID=3153558 RepID=UPI00325F771A
MGSLVVWGNVGFDGEEWAVGAARRYVRGLLEGEGVETGEALLVVSELATNAVAHGGEGGFEVVVAGGADVVRVEVSDSGAEERPRVREAGEEDETGRGLTLVEAVARRWGVRWEEHRTTVWAELERRSASPSVEGEAGR